LRCDQPRFYRRKNSIAHSDLEKNRWLELKSTPNLAIYGANLRRAYFGFQIQLVRSPETLKRRVFRNAASQFILIFECNRPGTGRLGALADGVLLVSKRNTPGVL